jgi:hypothetical protein
MSTITATGLTKRLMGRGWLPRDEGAVQRWLADHVARLQPAHVREAFEVYLGGLTGQAAAAALGITRPTYYHRHRLGFLQLQSFLAKEPERTKNRLFRSVYAPQFGDEVDFRELSTVLLGHVSNLPQLEWVPRVRAGAVEGLDPERDLPALRDNRYVWTKAQAERWRAAYAEDRMNAPTNYVGRSRRIKAKAAAAA